MRLLDPGHPSGEDLGKAFFLTRSKGCFAVGENLVGVRGKQSLVDTGCSFSGELSPDLFRQWTNQDPATSGSVRGEARFPNGVFGGMNYTNLYLASGRKMNSLGLDFLARHLVTLNFPQQTMYLQQRSTGSLAESSGFFDDFYPTALRKH